MSSDSNQLNKSSVDAILSSSDTLSASQVLNSLGFLSFSFLFWYPFVRDTFVHSCLSIFPGDSDCQVLNDGLKEKEKLFLYQHPLPLNSTEIGINNPAKGIFTFDKIARFNCIYINFYNF